MRETKLKWQVNIPATTVDAPLFTSGRNLDVMIHQGKSMKDDLEKTINLQKGTNRYTFQMDDPTVSVAEDWFAETLDSMEQNQFQHYAFPVGDRGRKRGRKRKAPIDPSEETGGLDFK